MRGAGFIRPTHGPRKNRRTISKKLRSPATTGFLDWAHLTCYDELTLAPPDAALADHTTAAALDTGAGAALLRVERLTHDAQGTPIDFERLYFRGDAFQYRLRLDRQVAAAAQSIFPLQGTV